MSRALDTWQTRQLDQLRQLEAAHSAVSGNKPGRRYSTVQINHALVVATAAQFQGFCRNLHSEAVGVLAAEIQDVGLRRIVHAGMTGNRALDRSNANADAIAQDFERVGIDIWDVAEQSHSLTESRRKGLMMLLKWRNAIAHQDFDSQKLGGRKEALLKDARGWRSNCTGLARTFDRVVGDHLAGVTNGHPWPKIMS